MWDYISDFDIFCWRSKNMLYFFVNRPWKRLSKNLLSIKRGFSKAYKYFVDIRKNKSNFLNLRKTKSPPLNLKFFLKSTRPSLPLKKAPPLFPSPFSHGEGWLHSAIWKRTFIALICTTFPLRGQGMYQPPYSVLKPLRYMVGGPSEVYASSGAAVFCAGMNPPCWRASYGDAETNAGCGDDNTFYSTLDRIDSGELPIRVMAEILWPSLACNEWHQRLRPLPNNSECEPKRTNTIALLFLSNQIKSVSFSIWQSI